MSVAGTPQAPEAGAASGGAAAAPAPRRRRPLVKRLGGVARFVIVLAAACAIWQLLSVALSDGEGLIPPPTTVFSTAADLLADGTLGEHALASLRRVLLGWGITAVVAIPLGLAMGRSRALMWLLEPLVEALRPIPPIAWIPITILIFGIGDKQNEAIIVVGAFFPLLLNTMHGVQQVDPMLVRAARTLGAGEWTIMRKVVWYNALPSIFTGLRISLGVAWMCLVAAELVGAVNGLGFMMQDARNFLRSDVIITGMLTIGVLGIVMDRLILAAGRRLMPWQAP
jgi:NitT/TauT family transport system permease protein/taurine transport system permease protein